LASQWNRDAERRIRESGISYTILRANYFMQNLFGNAEQIRQGAFTNGPAAKCIALIDARDIEWFGTACILRRSSKDDQQARLLKAQPSLHHAPARQAEPTNIAKSAAAQVVLVAARAAKKTVTRCLSLAN
jgi:hypothetical protein